MSRAEDKAVGKAFDPRLVGRLWRFVRPQWHLLVGALVLIAVMAGLEVTLPYLLKIAVDAHIAVHKTDGLLAVAVLFAAGCLGRSLFSMALAYVLALLGQRSMHGLRCAVHSHVLTRNATFFDRTPVGRMLTGITTDVDQINQLFVGGVVTLAADLAVLAAILGMMFYLSVELTLVTLAVVPLLVPLFRWARKVMRIMYRQLRANVAEMTTYALERISGFATVQIFCREARAARTYAQISAAHRGSAIGSFRAIAVALPVTETIAAISGALVIWYAGARTGETVLTVGLLVAFVEYANRLFGPVYVLLQKYGAMQAAMSAAERVFALLDTEEPDAPVRAERSPRDAAPADGAPDAAAALEFRDVHFGYRAADPVLHGVTLAVPRGATIAVVGATGSGKSTLVKLLARHYQAQSGQIFVDGQDVRDLPVEDLRRRLTVIAQDVFLFSGTVADNVRLGRPGAELREVEAALVQVGAASLLERKDGVNAEVLERGANLSTGERQLLSFARALIRDPEVLILDEATAHVDPETELTIERALVTLFAGRTSLIIAHRLSTIRRADRIVVMSNGRIVEHGTRSELLALDGVYSRLEAKATRSPAS